MKETMKMSDDRAARYIETADDGTERVVYRASALNMCDKLFVALANYYTPMAHPQWFQEVLDEGTRMEPEIRAMYMDRNDTEVVGDQTEIEMEVIDGVFIRGHIDGMTSNGALWEGKKFRESTWNKFLRSGVESMPWYPWQVSIYMHALELEECEFTGGLFKDGKIVDVYTHHLAMPPIPLLAIQKRVAKLEALINRGDQPADVKCTVTMFPCPMFYLHDADDENEPPHRPAPDDVMSLLAEQEALKVEIAPMRKLIKGLEDRQKLISQGVHAWMELSGVEDDTEYTVGDIDEQQFTIKHKRVFNPGSGPYDYVKVTIKAAPVKAAPVKAAPKLAPKPKGAK